MSCRFQTSTLSSYVSGYTAVTESLFIDRFLLSKLLPFLVNGPPQALDSLLSQGFPSSTDPVGKKHDWPVGPV
jgi:hypothetical protein